MRSVLRHRRFPVGNSSGGPEPERDRGVPRRHLCRSILRWARVRSSPRGGQRDDQPNPFFRFAPSPNGELHLGHALFGADQPRDGAGGRRPLPPALRGHRSRALPPGLRARHSSRPRLSRHRLGRRAAPAVRAFRRLSRRPSSALAGEGLVYPAFLSRGEIRALAERRRPSRAGPGRAIPTARRSIPASTAAFGGRARRRASPPASPTSSGSTWRGAGRPGAAVLHAETGGLARPARPATSPPTRRLGRRGAGAQGPADELPSRRHVDDALQGVTHVVRGRDLFAATSVHRLLQALLGLPEPVYHHHALMLGEDGRKLSKSRGDMSLALRAAGLTGATSGAGRPRGTCRSDDPGASIRRMASQKLRATARKVETRITVAASRSPDWKCVASRKALMPAGQAAVMTAAFSQTGGSSPTPRRHRRWPASGGATGARRGRRLNDVAADAVARQRHAHGEERDRPGRAAEKAHRLVEIGVQRSPVARQARPHRMPTTMALRERLRRPA